MIRAKIIDPFTFLDFFLFFPSRDNSSSSIHYERNYFGRFGEIVRLIGDEA